MSTGSVVDSGTFVADVDRYMLALVERRPGPIADVARRPIAAGGKRLRPLLVLAARPLDVGTDDAAARGRFDACAIRAASAVELVHTASLVHDDLLDGADLRRGEPTVGATDGRSAAIATGDLLFSLAFESLVSCRELDGVDDALVQRAVRVLARSARTLAEGEALQARQLRDPHLAESAYLDRCGMKTGVLFEASLQLGALLGGSSLVDVDVLGRFGRTVGIAFQLADDVLDCGAPDTEELLGKRPGADLRDGTITLPMLRAVQHDKSLAEALSRPVDDAEVEPLLERIRTTGALAESIAVAHRLRDESEALLEALDERFDIDALHQVAAASVDRLS